VGAVAYLLSLPLLVIHFLMIYSVSALTAVWTRSTVACVFVAALFWLITYGLNAGRHFALAWPEVANQGASFALIETLYWILPKPADLNLILQWAINAGNHYPLLPEFQKVVDGWAVSPLQAWLSVLSSLAFALAVLGLAGWEFSKTDY
jgi:hypothetical protein